MPHAQEEVEKLKQAPAAEGVANVIYARWSPRAFADKSVSTEDLRKIFDAARWAASSYNEQPWRFFVGRRGDATYQKIFDSLVEFNQQWAKSAPVLVLSVASKKFAHNGTPNYHALHDTGAATALLSLAATSLGLHTHSMAGFDHDKARKAFHIPEDYDMGAVTALGYLGDPESLPEQLKKNELSPRQRKDLSQFVFAEWEKPAAL
ncbi:nitroreductase family protein [Pseudacidobacterium ailaaui]|uniref:nitroreductase family protein n=1 Tax=Pseudacidobacterium ailaaui TaxID=1382359 RepID=UPI00047C2B7D|nr:nitroreductase family protein [Pseudacidobacterium ailaaui]MBX6359597.1 nitroreductase family protein [Pseudacidobacterium ailaaui]MCL6463381.1 nitroreductase family protein [Pseudacidobacterium ailaaui]